MSALLEDFADGYAQRGIRLDGFQVEACRALLAGRDVLVAAPTGSGKTVVAHFAVELALAAGRRCVYTAPIKALSNQKYAELAGRYGEETVGLLTGDTAVNRDAPVLVVTTEVVRNMLFANAPEIDEVGCVVLDEVHYLADRERGPVWEEVVLALPEPVRLVSLSATIANVDELAAWMGSVHGRTEVVTSEVRPVPLVQHVCTGRRLVALHGRGSEPSKALVSALQGLGGDPRARLGNRDRRRIISLLEERDMLPAIEFIFSRKGCDQAVSALVRGDVTLTNRDEQAAIRRRLRDLRGRLGESDLRAIGFHAVSAALLRGYGAHHAGMHPALKELAETLMSDGLLRIVYATGTLALGIDMPVRSVVVESLRRWDGDGFADLTATEYTQLIGRAGRRGKDDVGHAVVVGTAETDPYELAALGSGKVESLLSAFFPSYNTVVSLLAEQPYSRARAMMGRSFAQYQRNADLGRIEARLARIRRRIALEARELRCDRGDVVEYVRARAASGRAAKSSRKEAKRAYRARIADSFAGARNGVVYAVNREGELDYVLVLSGGRERLRVLDWYGEASWLREGDLRSELREAASVPIPQGRSLRERPVREDLADAIAQAVEERTELGVDRDLLEPWSRFAVREDDALLAHPCASCRHIGEHVRAAETLLSLDARERELTELAEGCTDSVGREFDSTAGVLRDLGILQGEGEATRLGPGAAALRALHVENDLLAYRCLTDLREGELDAAGFAGWASMFLGDDRLAGGLPHGRLGALARRALADADFLRDVEARHGLDRTREPVTRCVDVFPEWGSGAGLDACLRGSRMSAGDFVNAARRLIDLLGQMAAAGEGTWIGPLAREARTRTRRKEVM